MTRIGVMILVASIPLFASDTITLRDGSQRNGTFISASDHTLTFEENGVRRQYDLSQLQSVRFDPSIAFRNNSRPSSYADRGARAVNPDGRMISSGTEFSVRTNETIQATDVSAGRSYSATVEREVTDSNGQVVIPRGSTAQLVVRDMSSG